MTRDEVNNKAVREITMNELKEIMIDHRRVLVFEPLSGDTFISKYECEASDLIEKVIIKNNDVLENWIENGIVYYSENSGFNDDIVNAHFCDIWRYPGHEIYGEPTPEASAKAEGLGLVDGSQKYRVG